MEDIQKHGIPTYNFPSETDEDADQVTENEELRVSETWIQWRGMT